MKGDDTGKKEGGNNVCILKSGESTDIHGTNNVGLTILRLQRWWTEKPRLVSKL